jgi:pimeloyl-ACP methyl ester carboxylesterase
MAIPLLGVLVVLLGACGPLPPVLAEDGCPALLPGSEAGTVDVGDARLHVSVLGPTAAPPVVLLHGFPETGATWRAVAADLATDHRVVVPDLRGAGCSSFAPPDTDAYDARSLTGDVAGVTAALGLSGVTVVGHDLGAMTAVAWARARPDQVARVVLSGGGVPGFGLAELGPPHLRTFGEAPPGAVERAVGADLPRFLADFTRTPAFPLAEAVAAYAPPGRLDAAVGRYRALPRDAARNRADFCGGEPRSADCPRPRPLPMPVLVLAGGAPDLTVPTVTPLAPGRRVVVVPRAGHYVLVEQPAAFADAVRAFR